MQFIHELQTALDILEILEYIQSQGDALKFADIYIKSMNARLTQEGYDPLDGKQVLKFIAQVDNRFVNLV